MPLPITVCLSSAYLSSAVLCGERYVARGLETASEVGCWVLYSVPGGLGGPSRRLRSVYFCMRPLCIVCTKNKRFHKCSAFPYSALGLPNPMDTVSAPGLAAVAGACGHMPYT